MKRCMVKKCRDEAIAKGLCWKHYRRLKRNKTIIQKIFNKEKNCKVKNCKSSVLAKDLCVKHYMRQIRHGNYNIVKYKRVKV